MAILDDIRDSPLNHSGVWTNSWSGEFKTLDGVEAGEFSEADIEKILYHGENGDEWDGTVAALIKLKDGRLVAWQTWYGPTGSGFHEDAYGGDAELWFAKEENLKQLILQVFDDKGRELCGIPREGL